MKPDPVHGKRPSGSLPPGRAISASLGRPIAIMSEFSKTDWVGSVHDRRVDLFEIEVADLPRFAPFARRVRKAETCDAVKI